MSQSSYFRIQLTGVRPDQEDLLSSFCFEHAASGVAENLKFVQPREDFEPKIIAQTSHVLDIFFETEPTLDFYNDISIQFSNVSVESHREPTKDWLEEWKKGFEPFPLVGEIWVVPSWRPVPAACQKPIRIDPGMAFGTGTHDTTKLASEMLYGLGDLENCRVLDVGTGSGILAMLASHRRALEVVGLEIDPVARQVARENIKQNQMENIFIGEEPLGDHVAIYDVVVANIIDGVLIQLQDDLKRVVRTGGILITTGILVERKAEFEAAFSQAGLVPVRSFQKGEWLGYVWTKT